MQKHRIKNFSNEEISRHFRHEDYAQEDGHFMGLKVWLAPEISSAFFALFGKPGSFSAVKLFIYHFLRYLFKTKQV